MSRNLFVGATLLWDQGVTPSELLCMCLSRSTVALYFLSKDWAGSKWLPVRKV